MAYASLRRRPSKYDSLQVGVKGGSCIQFTVRPGAAFNYVVNWIAKFVYASKAFNFAAAFINLTCSFSIAIVPPAWLAREQV